MYNRKGAKKLHENLILDRLGRNSEPKSFNFKYLLQVNGK